MGTLGFPANPTNGTIFEQSPGLLFQYDGVTRSWVRLLTNTIPLPLATPIKAGAMSAADLRKLNRLLLPPPKSTIRGNDCVAPFETGLVGLVSGDKFIRVSGDVKLTNRIIGEDPSQDVPFHIHQHTFGFDFGLDLEALVQELLARGQLITKGRAGDQGEVGGPGEPGDDESFTGPKGRDGQAGNSPPCTINFQAEPLQATVAAGVNRAITAARIEPDPDDASKYVLVLTRQPLGSGQPAGRLKVQDKQSPWLLAVANTAAAPQAIYYVDIDPILTAIHDKYVEEAARMKKGYEDIVQFWVQTMSDLFDEQKAALCCALEFCISRTKSTELRQHMEIVAGSAAGNAQIRLHTRDSDEAVLLTSTGLLPGTDPCVGSGGGGGGGGSTLACDTNLLLNPGNELSLVGGKIQHWDQVRGTTWKQQGEPPCQGQLDQLPNPLCFPLPYEGDHYFYPGVSTSAELKQDVDVSKATSAIDAGVARFRFSGYVNTLADTAQIIVEYRDSQGTVLDSFQSEQFTELLRWRNVTDTRVAPPHTRVVRVRLVATKQIAGGSNDSYFDALSLEYVCGSVSVPCDQNLLKNPSAEEAGPDAGTAQAIKDWTILSGTWCQGNETSGFGSGPNGERVAPDIAPKDGSYYFYAGLSPEAELYQDTDVTPISDIIDRGAAVFTFTGWTTQTHAGDQRDYSRIIVEARDSSGTVLASTDSGNLSSVLTWIQTTLTLTAPAHTAFLRVRLLSKRNFGAENNGYYDLLSLTYGCEGGGDGGDTGQFELCKKCCDCNDLPQSIAVSIIDTQVGISPCLLDFSFPAAPFFPGTFTFGSHTHTETCKWAADLVLTQQNLAQVIRKVAVVLTMKCEGELVTFDLYAYDVVTLADTMLHYRGTCDKSCNIDNLALQFVEQSGITGACATEAPKTHAVLRAPAFECGNGLPPPIGGTPTDSSQCCTTPPPAVGSALTATITGAENCLTPELRTGLQFAGFVNPVEMVYIGTGAFPACGGAGFPAGSMKWISNGGVFIMRATCRATQTDLEFWYYTCNVNHTIGGAVIWIASIPRGQCNLDGVVLNFLSQAIIGDPGCMDRSSTVTLSAGGSPRELWLRLDPGVHTVSARSGVAADLAPGIYTAAISEGTAQFDGQHHANVVIQFNDDGSDNQVRFLDKGRFRSLYDARKAYEGLTVSFKHSGGPVSLYHPVMPTANAAGSTLVKISPKQVEQKQFAGKPLNWADTPADKFCEMTPEHFATYRQAWADGRCCGAVVTVANQEYIIVKRSVGDDRGCGGGESTATPCLARFHGAAFAWPTLDGKTFAPIPNRPIKFRPNERLSSLVAAELAAGNYTEPKGNPAGVRHLTYQLHKVLFPVE